jgi:hypothetical protein
MQAQQTAEGRTSYDGLSAACQRASPTNAVKPITFANSEHGPPFATGEELTLQ